MTVLNGAVICTYLCTMFTGIIECMGEIIGLNREGTNTSFVLRSPISSELKIDQSLAHNGVCLTVVHVGDGIHTVTAIDETMKRTNLKVWKPGDQINLERCLKLGDRMDGHWVTGHIDSTGICTHIEDKNGSYEIQISYSNPDFKTIEKGSITLDGISLTVINSAEGTFSVAIIPYTFENTSIKNLKVGDPVNLEFDALQESLRPSSG